MASTDMASSSGNSVSGEEIERVLGSRHDFVKADHLGCDVCGQLRDAGKRVLKEASSEAMDEFRSVLRGFPDAIEDFLRARSSRSRLPDNYSAFHWAAEEGHIVIVQFLLGVDPKPDGEAKGDAFLEAAKEGQSHVVEALLDVLDVDPRVGVDAIVEVQSTAIYRAAVNGDVGVVEAVLKHPKVNVKELARVERISPLHLAVSRGHTGVLKVLLEHPEFDVNRLHYLLGVTPGRGTPLHEAVNAGRNEFVKVLLKHPLVDVNAKGSEGATPLHVAIKNGKFEILELLLKHPFVDVNAADNVDSTPLRLAVNEGYNAIVEVLLKHPSLDLKATLCWAVTEGVELLLKHPSLDVNATFRLAVKEGDNEVVEVLFKHPSVDVNAKDGEGATPLHVAVKEVQNGVVGILLKHPSVDVNATCDGATPFHVAVCLASLNAVYSAGVSSWQNDRLEDMYLEKLRKAHLNDWFEETTERNYWKTMQLFAKHVDGHKLDQEDNYSKTALEYAYESKDVSIWHGLSQAEPVKNYIEGLYKDRQVYVDAANAILVGAALIASVTFGSWLQPPLSYTFEGDGYSSQSSPSMPKYVDVEHNVALRVFWVFNCFSFYFAMATVVAGACSVLPRRKLFIKKVVQKLRRYLIATTFSLGCSVLCVIVAFGISGSIVLAPMLKFQSVMIVPTTIGGLICLIWLGILLKNIVEDMELKDLQICLPRCFIKHRRDD